MLGIVDTIGVDFVWAVDTAVEVARTVDTIVEASVGTLVRTLVEIRVGICTAVEVAGSVLVCSIGLLA